MPPAVGHPSSLLIRWVHVLGMALLLGGAVLTWGTFRYGPVPEPGDAGVPLRVAGAYERLFWLGAGLVVVTGVGNLGSLAPAIPGPETAWGAAFAVKLAAVLGLLVGSPVRTLAVVRWSVAADTPAPTAARRLRAAYAATAVYLFVLVGLAEVLAHG